MEENYPASWLLLELEEAYEEQQEAANPKQKDWGIKLTANNVTATSLTLSCKQSGGQPTGDLQTGSLYWLETRTDSGWEKLPVLVDNLAWTQEALMISRDDTSIWEVDWSRIYGELSPGRYRIGKEIMDFRGTGDYDIQNYYCEFNVTDWKEVLKIHQSGEE